jgi:hypothetical protein
MKERWGERAAQQPIFRLAGDPKVHHQSPDNGVTVKLKYYLNWTVSRLHRSLQITTRKLTETIAA